MYKIKYDISEQEYDDFVNSHPYGNLLQTSRWAQIKKDDWQSIMSAVYDENNKIVATALILIRKISAFSFAYVPRGPVMDYANKELVEFYIENLRKLAKQKKWLFVKFDPKIVKRSALEKDFKNTEDNPFALEFVEYMKSKNVQHLGFTENLSQTIQPRFEAVIDVDNFDEKKLNSKNRNRINSAQKRNVVISQFSSEGVEDLSNVIKKTMERKSINLRQSDYFKLIMDTYQEKATISLAKLDVVKSIDELKVKIEDLNAKLSSDDLGDRKKQQLRQELQPLEKRMSELETYPKETIVMSGGLSVAAGQVLEQIYAGFDDTYKNFYPQYGVYKSFVDYAREKDLKRVNLGGVENNLEGGLIQFKSNFNPLIEEYVGEFDIVTSPLYHPLQFALKMRKKLLKRSSN